MKYTIEVDYEIGQTVYLITDSDQLPRIVTGYIIRSTGIIYDMVNCVTESTHYSYEISPDKDVLLSTSN